MDFLSKKLRSKLFASLLTVVMALYLVTPALAEDADRAPGPSKNTGEITTQAWTLTPQTDATSLVQGFLGSGITLAAPPTFTGGSEAAGIFNDPAGTVGFTNGIILSTGSINNVAGPNIYDDVTTDNMLPGDAALNTLIPGYTTYDATILEFDFTLNAGTAISSFQYVFASDEYNEFVNSEFNDVFAFYLNGQNIALIPGTSTPVAINNVNNGYPYGVAPKSNPAFYRNNDLEDGGGIIDTEMDGLTTVLTAVVNVQPGSTNHIKLAIADAGDAAYDSNVFLKANSFTNNIPPVISSNKAVVAVGEGQLAANTGIWSDQDDANVTLTTNVGAVTKNDNGTWSWSYQTGAGEQNQLVTIIATDPRGANNATSFELRIVDVQLITDFVTRLYQLCLLRAPDAGGLVYWTDLLATGQQTGADVAQNFIFSNEFISRNVSNSDFLDIMYSAFFDRAADPGGKTYWLDQMSAGMSKMVVLANFVNSNEFTTVCARYGIERGSINPVSIFVSRFYLLCLEREPDVGGLSYWSNQLLTGQSTGADMSLGFVFSPEFVAQALNNTDFLTVMYRAFFDREPDSGGLAYWQGQMTGGMSRLAVLANFVNSAEFAAICNAYGIEPGVISL